MDLLSNLLGERREEYRDFAKRYDRGTPYDDISEAEVIDRYREVTPKLSEGDYQDLAREAFSRLEPEERVEFGRQLREESLQQGCDFPGRDADDRDQRFEDPDYLARVMGRVHREQPHLLENLLNRGSDGLMGGMMGNGMTGGEDASGADGMTDNLRGEGHHGRCRRHGRQKGHRIARALRESPCFQSSFWASGHSAKPPDRANK